ncbi:hypothetical protein TMEN_4844 [Trichophyton mentagrophytes]|nr:hypothetical protein TMEN_4844 [Trichophyton mentagrophytes]
MSKVVVGFFTKIKKNFNIAKRFKATFTPGSRILPSKTAKNDEDYQLRLDAGELIDNRWLNIVLQVNSQAKSPGLRTWLKKNGKGTHGQLAISRFDTLAEDEEKETERVLTDLLTKAKDELKK